MAQFIQWFEDLSNDDVAKVGGKNASLGEMIRSLRKEGVRVPGGFATTAEAYQIFVKKNNIYNEIEELARFLHADGSLAEAGAKIRRIFHQGSFPEQVAQEIREAYEELSKRNQKDDVSVAVRSSATAEDLPEASFAGQQESFLNIRGAEDLLEACRECYASLFTDRAIAYREEHGFDHKSVALSVGVQEMVRSDKAGAGVMFSLDTDSGFPDVVLINAAWGLGETVVQGKVNPDEYLVFKPLLSDPKYKPILKKDLGAKEKKEIYSEAQKKKTKTVATSKEEQKQFVLSDEEILILAKWAVAIEKHYQMAMDMEWAKDGESGKLYCVQARPETVHSQAKTQVFKTYRLAERRKPIVSGVAIGQAVATGQVKVLESPEGIDRFEDGDVLVTVRTDPDWGPIMKRAAAIVTDQGGRTSHAAIVSRELGIPAIVGTGTGTKTLKDGQEVTISCAEGEEGRIYEGILEYEEQDIDLEALPKSPVPIMINLAAPQAAFRWWRLPIQGVGLLRMEFIIANIIKVHPLALARFDELSDQDVRRKIQSMAEGYAKPADYFIDHLSQGIAEIAASQYPDQVIVRMSDFKTNEYAQLLGGEQFEPKEENPMLGFRGASRYYSPAYKDGFALECKAVRRARDEIGLRNISVMLPFVRSLEEADRVIEVLAEHGLERGRDNLQLFMMCEVPSNIFLAQEFAKRFDGFSIGSNDLTQLILGVDRDSKELADLFDERNPAVKQAIAEVIERAHQNNCKVGICGQAPSDYPEFAQFLVDAGIDSISLNPDSVVSVIQYLSSQEEKS